MSKKPSDFNEKRELVRMKINTPVNIRVRDENVSTQAICKELSGNGMMVATDADYAIGASVEVTLAGKGPFKASAEVVRRTTEDDRFLIGLKLLEIHEQ